MRTKPIPLIAAALLVAFVALAQAEVTQQGTLRVFFAGEIRPRELPRDSLAPITISFSSHVQTTDQSAPPQLQKIIVAINRHGKLTYRGIPTCRMGRIDPSTTQAALQICRRSLVGSGHFSANVKLPEQSPFPSEGKVLAFNGRFKGRPAILAHIYGEKPAPTSYVLPFTIAHVKGGAYGAKLEASLPHATGDWGFVTGISLKLDRRFSFHGRSHSYLAADCPAPAGFPGATFPLARTSFGFEGGKMLTSVLNRSCKVRR